MIDLYRIEVSMTPHPWSNKEILTVGLYIKMDVAIILAGVRLQKKLGKKPINIIK